jgi:hypothetical protein
MRRRRGLVAAGLAAALVTAGGTGCTSRDDGVDQIRVTAVLPAPGGLTVAFPWPHVGYCAAQFSVKVVEEASVVRIGGVEDQMTRTDGVRLDCPGIGSNGRYVTIPAPLDAPLGTRAVIRIDDDSPVDVVQMADLERLFPPRRVSSSPVSPAPAG